MTEHKVGLPVGMKRKLYNVLAYVGTPKRGIACPCCSETFYVSMIDSETAYCLGCKHSWRWQEEEI